MKRLLAMLLGAALSLSATAQVSVTATQGTAGPTSYTTLGAAFTAINAGTHKGVIDIQITGNTTETASASLLGSASPSSYASVSIKPSGGARTISGTLSAALIDLNGADNVTIDGLNDGTNSLTISNLANVNTANTSTIRMINGATSNTVTRCTLLGSYAGNVSTSAGGTVLIATGSSTTGGNNNNTVSSNNIGPAGTNLPGKAINGNGSSSALNTNNTISNNNIYDYFQAAQTSSGIYLNASNSAWTITGNRFYQTAARSNSSGVQHSAIWAIPTNGTSITVTNNIIGYSSAAGTGTYTVTGSGSDFIPVYLQLSDGSSTISGNTITAISATGGYSGTTSSSPLRMINITTTGSNLDLTINDNIIGSVTAASAINLVSNTGSTLDVFGIFLNSFKTASISNNKIGGISLTPSGTSTTKMYGMYLNGTTGNTATVSSNQIGGSVANSMSNPSTNTSSQMVGIYTNGATVLTGNTVRNLSGAGGTSSNVTGIYLDGAVASTATQNTISALSNSGAGGTVNGILVNTGTTVGVSRNKIYDLSTSSTSASIVNGILMNGGTTVNIANNIIGDLKAPAISLVDAVRGISINSSTSSTAANVYFNSVYISGTSSGANFGSAAIYHRSSTTATTNVLTLRNNILVNMATAKGTGVSSALRRSASGQEANYATASNNNLFYAGTPSAANLLYYDGTNADQVLTTFKARITPRDAASISGSPNFISTTASSTDFLRLNTSEPTSIESGAAPISGYTTDFDGDTRNTLTPDMGADEFNGTACAVSISNAGALCAASSPTLNSSSSSSFNQWNLNGSALNGATNTTYVASVAGSYTVSLIAPTCAVTSAAKLVYAQSVAPAVLNASATGTVCAGSNVILTQTGGTLGEGAHWQWYTDAALTQAVGGALSSANAQLTVAPSATTTYYLRAEDGAAPCAATVSGSATVTVTIFTPSAGGTASASQSMCVGTTPADLALSGNNGSIVWQSATDAAFSQNLVTYSSTTTTLGGGEIGALAQTLYVRALVTNGTGCVSAASNTVTLTANAFPDLFAVQGSGTYCDGVGRAVGLAGSQSGVSYQLVKEGSNVGSPVAGTGAAISFGVQPAGTYTVTAINASNCSIAMSGSAVLQATGPFSAQISPVSSILCSVGAATSIDISAGPANGSVIVTTNGSNPVAYTLDANGAASFPTGTLSANTTYTIISVGNGTCMRTVSIPATVYVGTLVANPLPGQSVCPGATAGGVTFLGNFPAGTTYSWTSTNPAVGLAQTSGSGTQLPTFTGMNSSDTVAYSDIAVWPNITQPGCLVRKMVFRISIKPTPAVNAVGNQTVCAGTQTGTVLFTGNLSGTTYSWTNTNPGIGIGAQGAGDVAPFTATNNSAQGSISGTFTVTPYNTGCAGTPTTFTVTVNKSSATITYPASPYCQVGPANPRLVGTTGGVYSAPAGIVFYSTATGSINLGASTPGTYTVSYSIAGSAGGCGGTTTTQITILPKATLNPIDNQVLCQGAMSNLVTPTGSTSAYSWVNLNPAVGLAASGSGPIPAFMGVNNTTANVNAQVNVTPLGDGTTQCTGNAVAFRYTVFARPVVNPVSVSAYCRGVLTTPVSFSSATAGTTYTWTNSNTSIGLAARGYTAGLPSFTAQNPQVGAANTATITVTPTANRCVGTPYSFVMTVQDCTTQAGDASGDLSTMRLASQLVVGPNPAISSVTIEYKGTEAGPYTAQLLTTYGTPVGRVVTFSGNTCTMDLAGLTPGTYVLRFVNTRTQRSEQKQVIKL